MRKCALLFLTWMVVLGGTESARAASPLLPQHEQYKKIKAAEALAPLTSELFGDRVNLSSGSTEFVVTDIDLPGNNALPVKLQRRLVVQSFLEKEPVGGFGGWDIEVPYLHGTFDYLYKWDVGANATQRCSQRFTPKTRQGILIWEVFTGYSAHLPGEGDQSMLYIGAAGRTDPKPSDGAVYNWGTRNNMRLTCLPGTVNGYPGEGFLGVDSQGNRYFFNVGQERAAGNLTMAATVATNLVKVLLMASRIEDRYGNWVAYDYSGNKVTGIRSSDGRSISIAYSGDRIVSATANGRTWRYEYDEPGHWAGFAKWARLKAVVQPDGARWTYQYAWPSTESGGLSPSYGSWDGEPSMCHQVMFEPDNFTLQAIHPAGTQGLFEFKYARRGRTGVPPRACGTVGGPNGRYVQRVKSSFDVYALVRKTLSGPGIGVQVWSFERGGYASGIPNTTVSTVVEPDGTRKHSVYGIKLDENEGQLLAEAVTAADGSIFKQVRNTYVSDAEAAQLPFPDNYGEISAADDAFATKVRPLKAVAMSQDGVDFSRSTEQFDAFARSVIGAESNSLGYARRTNTTFFDDAGRWILGQVARHTLTVSGVETETARTEFDALSRPQRMFSFGLLQQSVGYHADGNIASLTDANGNRIQLNSWKRGLPQQVNFPDGSSSQTTVDDNGWVRSLVEPNGARKGYDYDVMGRITLATQAESDSVAWNPTTTRYEIVNVPEVGLEPGHWRRELNTGNARTVIYYDAMWRPVLEESYDITDRAGTLKQVVTRYDSSGRPVFGSYPTRNASDYRGALSGTYTSYDPLGRVTRTEADSELGRLATSTQYLPGGQVRSINPRGQSTTTAYMMYAEPSQDMSVQILHPEGAVTEIQRDVFGKPLSLLRRSLDGSISLRRQYVYDAWQRLCKSVEPESGATVIGYDSAGNVIWSAAGLSLFGGQCDTAQAHLSPARADRTYDSMNRVTSLRFSDGQGDQNWSYWPGGALKRVQTFNGGSSVSNEYAYNLRGLITSETSSYDDGQVWSLGYGYSLNGSLASLVYPSGLSIDFAPNAMGMPTRAGDFARDVRYYANGAMSGFTYGNGVTHRMTQNARGLPDRSTDAVAVASVLDDGYDYDANGNVAAISDGLPGAAGNRDMSYDGLDRLTAVRASTFGNASYFYDVLDNLTGANVGTRQQSFEYDHDNRLSNVRDRISGGTVTGLAYDPRGNLARRNGVVFRFDYGNRLREVEGKERYQYDAYGRRILASAELGDIRSMYGHDGVLRFQHDHRQAKAFDYVTLNGSLVAKRATAISPAALVLSAPAYVSAGAYLIQWGARVSATRYEVQERQSADWQAVYNGALLSVSLSGRVGGSYQYRGRACNSAGCGAWSALVSVQVQRHPPVAPVLNAPTYGLGGSFAVEWKGVSGAESYQLQGMESGAWNAVYEGSSTRFDVAGKPSGVYSYRIRACNPSGCSGYSGEVSVTVVHVPAAPVVSVPQASYDGSYVLTIATIGNATSYRVEQQINDGGWIELLRTNATNVPLSGRASARYTYRAAACNLAGCGATGSMASVWVTLPPSVAPAISLAVVSYSSSYGLAWTPVAAATRYELVEQVNGGEFSWVYSEAATSIARSSRWPGQWGYMVRGCNVGGCGPWSAVAQIRVIGPPVAPSISLPATGGIGATYTVTVGEVADATGYQLEESGDGVNWGVVSGSRTWSTAKAAGGTYYYRGRGCNPAGCGASSNIGQIAISSAPPVPVNVRVTIRQPQMCQVEWTPSPGATRYQIRGGSGPAYTVYENLWSLDARCNGSYTVRACNSQACSAWSGSGN